MAVRSLGSRRPGMLSTEHHTYTHPLTSVFALATIPLDDAVLAVSQSAADSRIGRRAKDIRVLHHGVNLKALRELKLEPDPISDELDLPAGPRIVTVANYRPVKGHRTLLEAAVAVHERRPDAHFITMGQGDLYEPLKAAAQRDSMTDYFHVLGPRPAAARWIAHADLFVLPSYGEGRPVALMEAQACGVASVATRVGGVPDMVDHGRTGLLVEPRSPNALTMAILEMLSSDELRARISLAGQVESETYDLAVTVSEIQEIYRVLATQRNGRRDA